MRGRYDGGSLAGFIIIGVVLTLVLVGGLYGLNRYNAEQTEDVAVNTEDDQSKPAASDTSDDQSPVENESKTDTTPQQSPPNDVAEGSERSNDEGAEKELPATGPADTINALIAVFALSFATIHYSRSRRLHK